MVQSSRRSPFAVSHAFVCGRRSGIASWAVRVPRRFLTQVFGSSRDYSQLTWVTVIEDGAIVVRGRMPPGGLPIKPDTAQPRPGVRRVKPVIQQQRSHQDYRRFGLNLYTRQEAADCGLRWEDGR